MWKSRNDNVFNRKQVSFERLKEEIKIMSFLWFKARSKVQGISWEEWCKFELSSCLNLL
ncbi:hypothetical protein HanRHA438_Chr12g0573601 [Helianthus annuus]|nr:hypothetical protein HanRHA438_Chr12g0573601 [Helianthus annuus]